MVGIYYEHYGMLTGMAFVIKPVHISVNNVSVEYILFIFLMFILNH